MEDLDLEAIKTKQVVSILGGLNVSKALIVTLDVNENLVLSARNIPGVRTVPSNEISVYDILKYDNLVITKDAVAKIQEVYA
jgi:large subunit ribosomal protein L4